VGTDYYRCRKCDLQVNDCIGGYDCCKRCDTTICYECCWKLKIRGRPIGDYSPGEPTQEFKMKKVIENKRYPDDFYYELLNCPYCKKLDKAAVDAKLLKFLLKKNSLTRAKAVKEMNNG
jgi:hypothetical protein